MTDVFISYSRDDQAKVLPIAQILKDRGWSVFMDVAIKTGERWDQVIEDNLKATKCVLVVWSPISVDRRWVREEAGWGRNKNILLPVTIDGAQPPIGYTLYQTQDLSNWGEDSAHPAFEKVLAGLTRLAGEPKNSGAAKMLNAAATNDDAAMRDWRGLDLDQTQDKVLLQSYESQYATSAPLWAYKAKQRREALDSKTVKAPSAVKTSKEKTAEDYYKRAKKYYWKDKNKKAIADFSEAIRLNPQYAKAYFKRGYTHDENGDYDKAIVDFSEAIRLNPQDAEAYNNRGAGYNNKGETDKGIADFRQALSIDPNHKFAKENLKQLGIEVSISGKTSSEMTGEDYFKRGVEHSRKGHFSKATDDFSEAIRLDPQYAEAYYNRGFAYRKKGDYDAAIADYSEAIHLNPQDAKAYNNRGFVYRKKGDIEKADADYRKALSIDPDYRPAMHNLKALSSAALILEKTSREKTAEDYSEAIRLNPQDAEAYNKRGYLYIFGNQSEKAFADLDRAIHLDPQYAEAYYNRGLTYYVYGKISKSITDFDEAIRLDPQYVAAYYSRGISYADKRKNDKAEADFRKVLSIDPNNESAIDQLKALGVDV